MTDPMQRAREMLAAEYEAEGTSSNFVAELRAGNVNRTGLGIPLRALAKALTHEDEVGWQDIETAPKDATLIDLWWDGIRLVDCWWQNENEHFPNRPLGWICSKNAGHPFALAELNAKPTHWMLPAPPAIRGRAAGGGDA